MRSFRTLSPLLLLLPSVVACSSSGDKPDAFVVVADAKPDAPPLPPGCDAQELRDDSNDSFAAVGSPEDSGLTFAATSPSVLCGKANSNHFEPATTAGALGVIDVDSFKFTLSAPATIYVTLSGAGLENLIGDLQIYSSDDPDHQASPALFGEMHAGHTASQVRLDSGAYEFDAIFLGDVAATADVSYKIRIVSDTIDTRCAALAAGGFAEAADGGANTGNDMIKWKYTDTANNITGSVTLTTAADTAEATNITAVPGMSYRVTGNSANNTVSNTDPLTDYKDADTFEFKTDATTNEITIRFKFPTATADLDIAIAPKPAIGATEPDLMDISNRLAIGPSEETLTTAVQPNTSYWLWVGGYKTFGPTATAMPSTASTYDATICAKAATP